MRGLLLLVGLGLVGYAGISYYLQTNGKTWADLPEVVDGLMTSQELLDEIGTVVEDVSASLPQTVDEITTWTEIAADGTTVIFRYVVDAGDQALAPDHVETIARPATLEMLCEDYEANALLRVGATYRSEFSAADGAELGSFEIDRFDCM